MSNNPNMTIRRAAPVGNVAGMPQLSAATGNPAMRLGQTGTQDTFESSKSSIDPLGLQSMAENRQMRGLLKSNVSALRHRISMAIINNIGG